MESNPAEIVTPQLYSQCLQDREVGWCNPPNSKNLVVKIDRKAGMAEADKYQADRWQAGRCHTDTSDQTDTDSRNDVLLQNRLDRNCPQDSEALQSSDSRGTWMTVCLRYSTTVAQERAWRTGFWLCTANWAVVSCRTDIPNELNLRKDLFH